MNRKTLLQYSAFFDSRRVLSGSGGERGGFALPVQSVQEGVKCFKRYGVCDIYLCDNTLPNVGTIYSNCVMTT